MRKPKSTATSRAGVNYTRAIVEEANCCFQPIEHENDFGVDAIIELVEDERPRGVMVGLQIKSGKSFVTTDACRIPADAAHRAYWSTYPLPLLGIVYDPKARVAFWVDLKHAARTSAGRNGSAGTLTFAKRRFNRLDAECFVKFLLPRLLKRQILLSFEESLELASGEGEEHRIGLRSLFYGHCQSPATWEALIALFRARPVETTDPVLLYFLAHVPWHGDIMGSSATTIPEHLREDVRRELAAFGAADVLKLLSYVDERGFERGTIGQNVDALISVVEARRSILRSIGSDPKMQDDVRRGALLLTAYYEQGEARPFLQSVACEDKELTHFLDDILSLLEQHGHIYLY